MKTSFFDYRSWPLGRQFAAAIFGVGVICLGLAVLYPDLGTKNPSGAADRRNTGRVLVDSSGGSLRRAPGQ